MKIDLKCPAECRGASIKTSTKTNENYALLKLFNLSDRVITELTLTAKFYDTYGKELGDEVITLTELSAQPKSFFAENKAISLENYPDAKHITAEFNQIIFEDGEEYQPDGTTVDASITEAEGDDAEILRAVAGDDAVCLAKDPGEYWVCVCGRVNENEASECVRCSRDKKEIMSKFSSSQALAASYEQKKIDDDRAELERYKDKERKKAQKKKKIAKYSLLGVIGIAAAAVLFGIIYLIYVFCAVQMGNIHLKNENYEKAYKLYSQVGSSSVSKVSEKVRGNSASNLYASGILAEDEKNYYYLDASLQIMIESKENGAAVNSGAAGLCLNASNGYVYYINVQDNYKICKLNPETKETEAVKGAEDQMAMFLTVIGNDLYYTAIETDATGQQVPVIYSLKEGKKPKLITDAYSQFFDMYKGKLYFISGDETQSLYCVDKPGAEPKLVLEGPLGQFEIKDDIIYYTDYTVPADSTDGVPVLSINSADMEGNFIKKITGEDKAYFFNISNDKMYFSNYSNNMFIYSISLDGGEATPLSAVTYSVLNTLDNFGVALTPAGQMEKINLETGESTVIATEQ